MTGGEDVIGERTPTESHRWKAEEQGNPSTLSRTRRQHPIGAYAGVRPVDPIIGLFSKPYPHIALDPLN